MKQVLFFCIFLTLFNRSAAQNSSDGDPVLSKPDTIATANFTIISYGVISNPYNSKSKSKGSNFYELSGYRLAEALQVMAREANSLMHVKELSTNPQIAVRIEFDNDSFTHIWPDVLKYLGERHNFRVSPTEQNVAVKYLVSVKPDLLHKNRSKSLQKGVVKATHVSKDGRVELIGYTISDLAGWLMEIWNQPVELIQADDGTRYTFNFSSTSVIGRLLPQVYGLEIQERIVSKQVQVVTP
jgi:hypothetical protein